jgi:hypothetical protein
LPKKFLLAFSSVCGISLAAGWAAGRFLPREGRENDLRRGQEKEREAHQLELRNRQLVFRIKELEEKLGGLAERKEAGEGKAQGDGAGSKAMSPALSRVADNSEELSLQRLRKTPLDEVKWEKLEEKKKNPFVAKHFSHLRRMPSSNSVAVARELAEDAGVNLDEIDSLILASCSLTEGSFAFRSQTIWAAAVSREFSGWARAARYAGCSSTTRKLAGFPVPFLRTISTSQPITRRMPSSRSTENSRSCPRRIFETFGWSIPIRSAAWSCFHPFFSTIFAI